MIGYPANTCHSPVALGQANSLHNRPIAKLDNLPDLRNYPVKSGEAAMDIVGWLRSVIRATETCASFASAMDLAGRRFYTLISAETDRKQLIKNCTN
jgi:hypothetical protein